jgi:hypothetical protein
MGQSRRRRRPFPWSSQPCSPTARSPGPRQRGAPCCPRPRSPRRCDVRSTRYGWTRAGHCSAGSRWTTTCECSRSPSSGPGPEARLPLRQQRVRRGDARSPQGQGQARDIGRAIGPVANMLGPERVIISGEGPAAYDLFAEGIRASAFGTAAQRDVMTRPLPFEEWARGPRPPRSSPSSDQTRTRSSDDAAQPQPSDPRRP